MRILVITTALLFGFGLNAVAQTPDAPPTANAKKEKQWKKKKDKMEEKSDYNEKAAKRDHKRMQTPEVRKRMKRSAKKAKKFNDKK